MVVAGAAGVEAAAKAPADGYTLVMGNVIPLVMRPAASKVPCDTQRDFDPVSLVATTDCILAVHPTLPNTPAEFRMFIRSESTRWTRVIRTANLKAE